MRRLKKIFSLAFSSGLGKKKPGSPNGRQAGYWKELSLSVAEGISSGLGKISSLSVAAGISSGIEKKFGHSIAEYALPAMDLFKRTAGQGLSRARGNMTEYALPAMDLFKRTAGQGLSRARGNMTEYALPAMLVGLVLLGGVAWLGTGQFAQTGAMSLFGGKSVVSQGPTGGGTGIQTLVRTRGLGENPLLQTMRFTTARGTVVNLPDMPINVGDYAEMAGGAGTTERYVAMLNTLADQLLAAGEIDEAGANAIKALANQGHSMGGDLADMEKLVNQCGNDRQCFQEAYQNTKTDRGQFEQLHGRLMSSGEGFLSEADRAYYGQTFMTEESVSGYLKLWPNSEHETLTKKVYYGEQLQQLLTQYDRVPATMTGPAREVLDYATRMIFQISQYHTSSMYRIAGNDSQYADKALQDVGAMTREMILDAGLDRMRPAVLVDANSATICATGQGQDTGSQCH